MEGLCLKDSIDKDEKIPMVSFDDVVFGYDEHIVLEILRMMVGGYFRMNQQEHMLNFYKVIYSERSIQPMAAKILAEETEKMIIATKQ